MPKVFLVNPRPASTSETRAKRSGWDRGAVKRILNASGGWDLLGEGGQDMAKHHGGYHRRRNPAGNMVWGVAGAAGGFLLTGTVAGMVAPSGVMNYLAQGGVALAGGWALGKWKKPAGYGFTIGGLAKLALTVYSDFVGGGASPGTSYYAQTTLPVPTYSTGSPLGWPAFQPGGPANLPVGTSPASNAVVASQGGNWSRLKGRLSN